MKPSENPFNKRYHFNSTYDKASCVTYQLISLQYSFSTLSKMRYSIIPKQYHGFSKARVTSPGCGLVEFSDYVAAQYAITQLNQKSQFLGQ